MFRYPVDCIKLYTTGYKVSGNLMIDKGNFIGKQLYYGRVETALARARAHTDTHKVIYMKYCRCLTFFLLRDNCHLSL